MRAVDRLNYEIISHGARSRPPPPPRRCELLYPRNKSVRKLTAEN